MRSLVTRILCAHRQLIQDHLGRTTCRSCGAVVDQGR